MSHEQPAQEPARRPQQLEATVHGRVQGVNFRYYTQAKARSLGLGGYVRNLPDGSVQVVAQGDERALRALLAWLHRGSPLADVTRVEVAWRLAQGSWHDFEVRG